MAAPKNEPDIRAMLREIRERAREAGVTPKEYLEELIGWLDERRRARDLAQAMEKRAAYEATLPKAAAARSGKIRELKRRSGGSS